MHFPTTRMYPPSHRGRWGSSSLAVLLLGCWCMFPAQGQLLLAGGRLSVCSSVNHGQCRATNPEGRGPARCRIDAAALERAGDRLVWENHEDERDKVLWQLKRSDISEDSCRDLLRSALSDALRAGLSDYHYQWLMTALEVPQMSDEGRRLTEVVDLQRSRLDDAVRIYRFFVEQSARIRAAKATADVGTGRPSILILTASAQDSFSAVDYYLDIFRQAGADASWLPLDTVIVHAIRHDQCDTLAELRRDLMGVAQREAIYPDLALHQAQACKNPADLISRIRDADGLFINGGDQSLTLRSLSEPFALAIRQQFAAGKLVVGGTSAGAAVQASDSMMVMGSIARALEEKTGFGLAPLPRCARTDSCMSSSRSSSSRPGDPPRLLNTGGLGLLPIGIVDTHFTERDRHVRLATMMGAARLDVGVGVDETTAAWYWREDDGELAVRALGKASFWLYSAAATGGFTVVRLRDKATIRHPAKVQEAVPPETNAVRSHDLAEGLLAAFDASHESPVFVPLPFDKSLQIHSLPSVDGNRAYRVSVLNSLDGK